MPEIASCAFGRQKFVVGASRPYVIDPPVFCFPCVGALAPEEVARPPQATVSATTVPAATLRSPPLALTCGCEPRPSRPPIPHGDRCPARPAAGPGRLNRPVECDGRHSRAG